MGLVKKKKMRISGSGSGKVGQFCPQWTFGNVRRHLVVTTWGEGPLLASSE